jgi:hypothetical protein
MSTRRWHICPQCGKRFRNHQALVTHVTEAVESSMNRIVKTVNLNDNQLRNINRMYHFLRKHKLDPEKIDPNNFDEEKFFADDAQTANAGAGADDGDNETITISVVDENEDDKGKEESTDDGSENERSD